MKTIIAISLLLITGVCFGQKKDSLNKDTIPVVSLAEMNQYLGRINIVAMKQFNLTEQGKHQEILKELQAILAEVERKSKKK